MIPLSHDFLIYDLNIQHVILFMFWSCGFTLFMFYLFRISVYLFNFLFQPLNILPLPFEKVFCNIAIISLTIYPPTIVAASTGLYTVSVARKLCVLGTNRAAFTHWVL